MYSVLTIMRLAYYQTSLSRVRSLAYRQDHIAADTQFINNLSRNGKNLNTGKPLSRKTVVHHLSFISDVFGYAVKMVMLTDNPCSRVSVPKGEKREKQIYRRCRRVGSAGIFDDQHNCKHSQRTHPF